MMRAEALTRLRLDLDATREEIEVAWRAAIKRTHPDSRGESDGRMAAALNEAREVALMGLREPSREVVMRRDIAELVREAQESVASEVRASERAMQSVVVHHVGQFAHRRRQRAILAAVCGGVGTILAVISSVSRFNDNPAPSGLYLLWGEIFGVVAAVLAVGAWHLAAKQRVLQLELDDVGETLSDKAALSDTLNEIDVYDFFSRSDLHKAVEEWVFGQMRGRRVRSHYEETIRYAGSDGTESAVWPFSMTDRLLSRLRSRMSTRYRPVPLVDTARRIGVIDFSKLLLAKGIELAMLREDKVQGPDGPRYGYSRMS